MQILVKKAAEAGYCEFAFRILQIARFAASAHFINCSCYIELHKKHLFTHCSLRCTLVIIYSEISIAKAASKHFFRCGSCFKVPFSTVCALRRLFSDTALRFQFSKAALYSSS